MLAAFPESEISKAIDGDNLLAEYGHIWQAQEGPQALALDTPVDITLFGGTRGGGKTDAIVGRQTRGALRWAHKWNGLVIRQKFKEFAEIRRRFDELIRDGLPAERIGGDQQINHIRFENGAQVKLDAIGALKQAEDHQGMQYVEISVDEGPKFPFILKLIDLLKGCLRSPHGIPCHLFITGNPGGSGSTQVKHLFMTRPDGTPLPGYNEPGGGKTSIQYDKAEDGRVLFSRAFIKSKLSDNKILCEKDPRYVDRLRSIKDEALRKAWLDGDWDVFLGQAFNFVPARHVLPSNNLEVPDYAPIYMTLDWGFGRPFSIAWWWVDGDGRLYRFAEWYGWNGTPDEGLRLVDSMVADGIKEREAELGLTRRAAEIDRISGPDCFAHRPNYEGGGQGKSTAEVFAEHGLILRPGDAGPGSRILKIRQFRERLMLQEDGSLPMMVVYPRCIHFIRTIPTLSEDEDNIEDVDTNQEDHVYDEACLLAMARPLKLESQELAAVSREVQDWQIVTGQSTESSYYGRVPQQQGPGAFNLE